MFKHLFRMIWNKKKQNFLLITEMLISFLVLFAVFTLLVYFYQNYRKPMGFEYENVWVANYNNSNQSTKTDSLIQFYDILTKTIQSFPQVNSISICSDNVPFSQSTIQNGFKYQGKAVNSINWHTADERFKEVLGLKITAGRWFDRRDILAKNKAVVINSTLKEELFGKDPAIGKLIGSDNNQEVIGIIEDPKFKGDYTSPGYAMINLADTGNYKWFGRMLISVKPGTDAAFESKLYKTLANLMKGANIEIEHLTDKRKSVNYFALVPMIILSIVAAFLIINVALGLFGVLWYNINKRRGEIGLRRAVGATGNSVSGQLVAEAMILATLSIIIGAFFAVQFPLLNVFDLPAGVYVTAILLSVLFIYVLVLICSLYPGRQAAAIYPAIALHEE